MQWNNRSDTEADALIIRMQRTALRSRAVATHIIRSRNPRRSSDWTTQVAGTADRGGWITQVGTIPEWRGRGLAAGLIAHVMRPLRTEALNRVVLFVNTNNPSACALYRRLGFESVTRRTINQKQVA